MRNGKRMQGKAYKHGRIENKALYKVKTASLANQFKII